MGFQLDKTRKKGFIGKNDIFPSSKKGKGALLSQLLVHLLGMGFNGRKWKGAVRQVYRSRG